MNGNAPVVWLVQELRPDTQKDISNARGYGSVEHLLPWSQPMPSVDPQRALQILREKVKDVRDGDFILDVPGCDPVACLLVGIALGEAGMLDSVKWLRWDRRTDPSGARTNHGYYTPVDIRLGGNTWAN